MQRLSPAVAKIWRPPRKPYPTSATTHIAPVEPMPPITPLQRFIALPPAPVRADRRGLQHRFGHSGLPRSRRAMEARAAGDLSGVHGRAGDAAALLGAQPGRLAPLRQRAAERHASRAGAARARLGKVSLLVTQNVDRLHQHAGSERVIDLHGRLDEVRCMSCDWRLPRHDLQRVLVDAIRRGRSWMRPMPPMATPTSTARTSPASMFPPARPAAAS